MYKPAVEDGAGTTDGGDEDDERYMAEPIKSDQ